MNFYAHILSFCGVRDEESLGFIKILHFVQNGNCIFMRFAAAFFYSNSKYPLRIAVLYQLGIFFRQTKRH